ncbi:hypothetical protein [Epilithonimonas xixisoli]|nr:hypothetical protein [Epilithonimonas xixisoli]
MRGSSTKFLTTLSPTGKSMNTRVLELIKNPKIIIESDLHILESESEKMPYAQSIRALYLYGTNLYKTESYKENLSKTAAYTTDKKILYQFINSEKNIKKETENQIINNLKEEEKPAESKIITEIEAAENNAVLNKFDVEKIIESERKENSEFIVVEGEKNRLLYEGEENFLEEKSEEIDMEATKESGVITIKDDLEVKETLIVIDENRSEETISEHLEVEEVLETPEEKMPEQIADTQVQDEDSSGNISFNGIEEFLPQVKFSVPKNHLDYLNPPKKSVKKEENSTPEKTVSKSEYIEPIVPKIDDNQISFENTQAFEVSKPTEIVNAEPETEDNINESEISFENTQAFEVLKSEAEIVIEKPTQKPENQTIEKEVILEQPISEWKPMSFSSNVPDSLIGKKEVQQPKQEIKVEEKVEKPAVIEEVIINETPIVEEKPQTSETERPVMNVSFFGNDVSKIKEEKELPSILDKPEVKETVDSNVGTFINTWQSWLKIDRPKSDESPEKTIVVKEKIIDQFIEKNPKISQLKEEVSFIVKEKKDDISHLMTETLANLYVEQKLYSKAIKAYEILIEKHPQKEEHFLGKIEEIKEIRKS